MTDLAACLFQLFVLGAVTTLSKVQLFFKNLGLRLAESLLLMAA